MIDLLQEDLLVVKEILKKWVPQAQVYVFGSRIRGTAKPFSDLDLSIDIGEPIPIQTVAQMAANFSESHLPIKVDVVDWHNIDDGFRKIIKENCEQLIL